MKFKIIMTAVLTLALNCEVLGQRRTRNHTINQSKGISLVPAYTSVTTTSSITITSDSEFRYIRGNGIPNHKVGSFPNSGNPHQITSQDYSFRVPLYGKLASSRTKLELHTNFGIAINGIPFDPGAAEWYLGNRNSSWQYEALSGAVALGVDENHAHVQPTGAYHYHGLPTELLNSLKIKKGSFSPLIGWAADGFPIYAIYGMKGEEVKSSYTLKNGSRPSGSDSPGGKYDGTFINDYIYQENLSPLDQCNGMFIKNEEYPNGTYAYFLTKSYPVIPRCFKGTPDSSFKKKKGNRQMRGHKHRHRGRPPHHHRGFPPPRR